MRLFIYVLDTDPVLCAQMLNDKHLTEVLWTCDTLLSNRDTSQDNAVTKHVLFKWTQSYTAFKWVEQHYNAIIDEAAVRFPGVNAGFYKRPMSSKVHTPKRWVQLIRPRIPGNAVKAYRDHYLKTQQAASWTRRGVPSWWQGSEQLPLTNI